LSAIHDRQGLIVTAANEAAARHLDDAVVALVGFRPEPMGHVKAALAADPDFVLAQVLRGLFYLMIGLPALVPKARACLETARALADRATPRERAHVAALAAACAGDVRGALDCWEGVLIEHPTDLLALRLAHSAHFDLGESLALRDGLARVLPDWSADQPSLGHVLGMYAFGLEEAGDYRAAERHGRRAVEIDPSDIWAVHAVAHVLEMEGRQREGIDWIAGLAADFAVCDFFVHHVWWHKALYHLDLGEDDAALALYDERVRDDFSDIVYDIIDAASLLWRLELAGIGVGQRWEELGEKAAARLHDHVDAFADAHFAICLAGAGRADDAAALIASMRAFAAKNSGTMAPIIGEPGVAIAEGLVAYRAGDPARAIDLLLPRRYDIWRIGGSHAQRDLFAQTLIHAALAADRPRLARALLIERVALKPNSPRATAALTGCGKIERLRHFSVALV